MSAADTLYAPRFAGPELIERGRTNTLTCPVYRDGALASPTTGDTVSIYRPDGSLLVTATITKVSNVATYPLLASTMSAESYGENWVVEWALTMPDGVVHTFRRDMALCRRSLYPVVTDADLVRRHNDLAELRPSTLTSYQDYLDEAWVEMLHRLRQGGSLAQLICSPEDLRYVHLYRTLELIFRDFMVTAAADSKWATLAQSYADQGKAAWGQLAVKYDTNEDGVMDSNRRAMAPVTFLGCGGEDPWYYVESGYNPPQRSR